MADADERTRKLLEKQAALEEELRKQEEERKVAREKRAREREERRKKEEEELAQLEKERAERRARLTAGEPTKSTDTAPTTCPPEEPKEQPTPQEQPKPYSPPTPEPEVPQSPKPCTHTESGTSIEVPKSPTVASPPASPKSFTEAPPSPSPAKIASFEERWKSGEDAEEEELLAAAAAELAAKGEDLSELLKLVEDEDTQGDATQRAAPRHPLERTFSAPSAVSSDDVECASSNPAPAATKKRGRPAGPKRNKEASGNVVKMLGDRERAGEVAAEFVDAPKQENSNASDNESAQSSPQEVSPRPKQVMGANKRVVKSGGAAGLLAQVVAGAEPVKLKKTTSVGAKKRPVLMKMKGKLAIATIAVDVSVRSLNHHDVFVYDNTRNVYVFYGRNSSRIARSKAVEVSTRLKDKEYQGRANVVIMEDCEDMQVGRDEEDFWRELGGRPEDIPSSNREDDLAFDDLVAEAIALYAQEDGQWVKVDGGRKMRRSNLDSRHSYVVDCLDELYVWNGNRATDEERDSAMAFAKGLRDKPVGNPPRARAEWCDVETCIDNGERVIFKEKFFDWADGMDITVRAQGNIRRKDKTPFQTGADVVGRDKIDVKLMYGERLEPPAHVDNATGDLRAWHCTEKQHTELAPSEYGQLFASESYVVLYKRADKKDMYIMYFWQGSNCRPNDKGAAALFAADMDKDYGAPLVRVIEGKEPPHFLSIFQKHNGCVVHQGSREDYNPKKSALFKVFGSPDATVVFDQFTRGAGELSSNCVYVVSEGPSHYIWVGQGSSPHHLQAAAQVCSKLLRDGSEAEIVHEGHEPSSFWQAVGGKADYASAPHLRRPLPSKALACPVRAWIMDNASGEPRAHEIAMVTQEDLKPEAVLVLDCWHALYVWVGPGATQQDLKTAITTAKEYQDFVVEREPDRVVGAQLVNEVVYAGEERLDFQAYFPVWDPEKAKRVASETSGRANIRRRTDSTDLSSSYEELTKMVLYTLEELNVPTEQLAPGVDPACREKYLLDSEFQRIFGMTKDDYERLPKWRQIEKKKKTPLF